MIGSLISKVEELDEPKLCQIVGGGSKPPRASIILSRELHNEPSLNFDNNLTMHTEPKCMFAPNYSNTSFPAQNSNSTLDHNMLPARIYADLQNFFAGSLNSKLQETEVLIKVDNN